MARARADFESLTSVKSVTLGCTGLNPDVVFHPWCFVYQVQGQIIQVACIACILICVSEWSKWVFFYGLESALDKVPLLSRDCPG